MAEEKLKPKEVAERLGLTTRQLQNLVERGLKKHGNGKQVFYVWSEVFPWYLDYKLQLAAKTKSTSVEHPDLELAQARKYEFEAQRAELKLAKERGEVAAIADIEHALSSCFATVRSRLLSMPAKLAPNLANTRKPAQAKAIVENEILAILAELIVSAGVVHIEGSDAGDVS